MTEILTRVPRKSAEWVTCGKCRHMLYGRRFARVQKVCAECGHHAPLTAPERIEYLLDQGSVSQPMEAPPPGDPLTFVDTRPYPDRLREAASRTGLDEAVVCVRGTILGKPVIAAVMDFRFLGGSLGSAVGELITSAAETALRERTPLLLVTASGGARMQEGIISLLQMAKTSQALAALDEAGVLTITLVTDPTFGGVAASFATLTDVILAEPGARMGFAGRRVIEQTIRQSLPKGFQTAEFLLENGLIDDVVPRRALRPVLARLLTAGGRDDRVAEERPDRDGEPTGPAPDVSAADPVLRDAALLTERDSWQTVQLARNIDRPTTLDYLNLITDGFQELHGDHASGDCSAIVGGLAGLDGRPVMVIGHQKGHATHELVARNFGMPRPEGYRKAARLMRVAGKLGVPVITLIDTPGAYPGIEAEQRGQAIAVAENLRLMCGLPVPIVAVVTGEGGSGGALALGVADRVLLCANAVYSVISPEGCAAILWDDPSAAPKAAAALRMSATDLLRLGVIDGVVPEPPGGAHTDPQRAAELLHGALVSALDGLDGTEPGELVRIRRRRFRNFGASADLKSGEWS